MPKHSPRRPEDNALTLAARSAQQGFTQSVRSAQQGFTQSVRSAQQGFTLVELMVVIVILGVLAAIVAVNVIPFGDKAKVQAAKSDIANISQALELYKLQNGNYPATTDGLTVLVNAPAGADAGKLQTGFIKKLPNDPWNHPYLYTSPGEHGAFDVWSQGADGKPGGEGPNADIGSW